MNSAVDRNTGRGESEELGRLNLPAALLVILCCALWGGNSVAVKFTVEHIPPIGCAGIRFMLSLLGGCALVGWSLYMVTRPKKGSSSAQGGERRGW